MILLSNNRWSAFIFSVIQFLLFPLSATQAQVIINEICIKNSSVIADHESDYPDWIELYNPGNLPEIITGYYLSDDSTNVTKWQLPSTILQPHSYLIIFASGKDITSPEYHTNFKLSIADGKILLSRPDETLADYMNIPELLNNNSYGRVPDGTTSFYFFDTPTPGVINSTIAYKGYVPAPFFSEAPGFFLNLSELKIKNAHELAVCYYTLDGSMPDEQSMIFNSALNINQTTVIRTQAFADSLIPSQVVTGSFFIGKAHKLPVLSLAANPSDLFDDTIGITMMGPDAETTYPYYGANFWKDTEIAAHLEYFIENKTQAFAQNAGIKIHGGTVTRTRPMKAFRIIARDTYNDDDINFKIFKERQNDSFQHLVLRNAGGDFNKAHCRDGLIHRFILREQLNLDAQAYQPLVVYINGQYWGVQEFRERSDGDYIQDNYGFDPDAIDLIEEDTTIWEGNLVQFNQMLDFITNNDLADDALFAQAAAMIDTQSICDYIITETYLNNTDWPNNNLKYWKARDVTAKWRYILIDLDAGLNGVNWVDETTDNLSRSLYEIGNSNKHMRIFNRLLTNTGFRNYFINRYADLMNTSFEPAHFKKYIEELRVELEPEMPDHFTKWSGNIDQWNNEFNTKLIRYAEQRPTYARQYLQIFFNLEMQVKLELNVYPENAGKIKINTVTPASYPWEGIYYKGVPVTLTVIPNAGYSFSHWQSLGQIDDTNLSLTFDFENDDAITAIFEGESENNTPRIFPNPANKNNSISVTFVSDKITAVEITLTDVFGKSIRSQITEIVNAGTHQTQLDISGIAAGIYFVTVSNGSNLASAKLAIVD